MSCTCKNPQEYLSYQFDYWLKSASFITILTLFFSPRSWWSWFKWYHHFFLPQNSLIMYIFILLLYQNYYIWCPFGVYFKKINWIYLYIYIYIYINKALRIVNRLRKIGKWLNLGIQNQKSPIAKKKNLPTWDLLISTLKLGLVRATALSHVNFLFILHKKLLFSILYTHFYKTFTLVYLFYTSIQ